MMTGDQQFDGSSDCALRMDRADPLQGFRDRFTIPDNTTYLCGNCLGLQPKAATDHIADVMSGWATKGFRAHFVGLQNWLSYEQDHLAGPMAEIVGALPIETAVMNSLTANLHLMLISFYRPRESRYKILIEEGAFPSDQFAVHSQIRLHGYTPEQTLVYARPRDDAGYLSSEAIVALIEERGHEFALILLGNTGFRNGQALDMESITRAGHKKGCVVGFDLAHAAGNIELKLHDWAVDFAVWCTYKYLNGGPGSPGGCFVHERYAHDSDLFRLQGWWGNRQDSRFDMNIHSTFKAAPGAQGWQLSSAPILSMAALCASLEIFADAKMERLRRKSVQLGNYLQFLLDERLSHVCTSITPRNPAERGCQFTLKVKAEPRELQSWLYDRGVVCDAHGKDMIRVSPTPLYNNFADIHRLITNLERFFVSYRGTNPGTPPGYERSVTKNMAIHRQ